MQTRRNESHSLRIMMIMIINKYQAVLAHKLIPLPTNSIKHNKYTNNIIILAANDRCH